MNPTQPNQTPQQSQDQQQSPMPFQPQQPLQPPQTQQGNISTSQPFNPLTQFPTKKSHVGNVLVIGWVWLAGIFVVLVLLLLAVISVYTFFEKRATNAKNVGIAKNMQELNEKVAGSSFLSADLPDLSSCWPADSMLMTDKHAWSQDVVNCASKEWSGLASDIPSLYQYRNNLGSKLVFAAEYKESDTQCGALPDYAAAIFCRADNQIYVKESLLNDNALNIAHTILHEYVHQLSYASGLSVETSMDIFDTYRAYPSQPASEEVADSYHKKRLEQFADCVSMGMLSKSQKLSGQKGADFIRTTEEEPSQDPSHIYGTKERRQKFISEVVTNPTMATCNFWRLPDSEL
ncbi:hypothetical protein KDA06_04870 [Candidatus Saccharibacteria bacterium]|nr:hypothetical protein [Candidatus Saccharibacteria bacterium]